MKRIFLGAAAAVMTLLSACEAIGPQESEQPGYGISGGTSATQLFTATIGADTKTHLQYDSDEGVYKTVWSEGDYIYVIDPETGRRERCPIVDGVGTSSATFAGTMEADSYIAFLGDEIYPEDDAIQIYLPSYQDNCYRWDSNSGKYLNMFGPTDFPMIARSDSKNFEFRNLCSVLKISITGNGELVDDIYFTPNDESICTYGYADVSFDGAEPVMTLEYNEDRRSLWFDTWYEELSSESQDYYIALPSQTYTGGFTLEIQTDAGTKTVTVTEDIEMRRSHIRTLRVDYSEGIQEEDSWGVSGSFTDWADGADILMENMGDGWYMASIYMESGAEFKLRKNGLWDGTEVGVGPDVISSFEYVPTNTFVPVYSRNDNGTYNITVYVPGYYDVWYNPQTNALFVMSSGISPFELPTMEPVAYPTYQYIYDYATEGSLVKVTGLVMAKCDYGFILAVENKIGNNIYVYDSGELCDAELGDIVDVCAPVKIYNELPELVIEGGGSHFHKTLYSFGYEMTGESPVVISDLDSYSSTGYTYIRYTGLLDGSYVRAEGDSYSMKITNQSIFDLTEYDGQMVCVEGYYAGPYSTRHNIILKSIAVVSEDTIIGGSTENITQGESFPVTSRQRSLCCF